MIPRRLLPLLLALPLLVASCKTPEEKLVDRRRDLRSVLDRLHEEYRHDGQPDRKDDGAGGVVGRIFGELDRASFEQGCLAAGRGERTFDLSGRMEAFLKDGGHERACRKAADLELQIGALEREVSARDRK